MTGALGLRSSGRFIGLVDGLKVGDNLVTARAKRASAARITITNHPIGGPIFSGTQVQPWLCSTAENGLGPEKDIRFSEDAVRFIVRRYTREAGMRS